MKVEEELEVEVEEEMEVEVEEAGCRTSDTQGSMAALAEAEAWFSDNWRLITCWMARVRVGGMRYEIVELNERKCRKAS